MKFASLIAQKKTNNFETKVPTVVFFGDSVTQGSFGALNDTDFPDMDAVYHKRLIDMIRDVCPGVQLGYINAGIGGDNAVLAVGRLDRDVLCYHPDLVVVAFGLNDVPAGEEGIPAFKRALSEIFSRCLASGAEVVYLSPNIMNTFVQEEMDPSCKFYDYAHKTARFMQTGLMDRYIEAAKETAREHDVRIADAYAKWKALAGYGFDTTRLLANGINHPTRAMHRLFAETLFDTIFFTD